METKAPILSLHRDAVLNLCSYLPIESIFRFVLCLPTQKNPTLLSDDQLFMILCDRDFDHHRTIQIKVKKLADRAVENPWTWKAMYRILLGFKRQLIHEMRLHRGLEFCCSRHRLKIPEIIIRAQVPMPVQQRRRQLYPFQQHHAHDINEYDSDDDDDSDGFFDDEDEFGRPVQVNDLPHPLIEDNDGFARAIHADNIQFQTIMCRAVGRDEDGKLAFAGDDPDLKLIDLDWINLRLCENALHRKSLVRHFPGYQDRSNFVDPGPAVVDEGLAVWIPGAKAKHCKYKLLYPMEKLREVFEAGLIQVDKEVLARKAEVDKVLNQKFIMRYRLDKPEILTDNVVLIWKKLQRIFIKAELHIDNLSLHENNSMLVFNLSRKVEWVHDRICAEADCMVKISRKVLDTPVQPGNVLDLIRHHLCPLHSTAPFVPIQEIIRARKLHREIEYLNFLQREFKNEQYHLNLDEVFKIKLNKEVSLVFTRLDLTLQNN